MTVLRLSDEGPSSHPKTQQKVKAMSRISLRTRSNKKGCTFMYAIPQKNRVHCVARCTTKLVLATVYISWIETILNVYIEKYKLLSNFQQQGGDGVQKQRRIGISVSGCREVDILVVIFLYFTAPSQCVPKCLGWYSQVLEQLQPLSWVYCWSTSEVMKHPRHST